MESFEQGHRLTQDELSLNIYSRYNHSSPYQTFPCTPYYVAYDIGFIHATTGQFVPIGKTKRSPRHISTGRFCPNFILGEDWKPGTYEIKWYISATETSQMQMTSIQFSVVSNGTRQSKQVTVNHHNIPAVLILIEET
jgi:hypothetical protein